MALEGVQEMRRLLSLAVVLALSASLALAAIETTTIQGRLYLPSGGWVTSGTITAVLSSPGTMLDGASYVRVGGRFVGSVDPNGYVSGLVLAPNDAIDPNGTYYLVSMTIRAPIQASWTELWSVATNPDPVDIGAVTRLGVPSGLSYNVTMSHWLTGSAASDPNFTGGFDQDTCKTAIAVTVTGANIGDPCFVGQPDNEVAGIWYKCRVSATSTVSITPCCLTPTDCSDPASGTYKVVVWRW